MQDVVLGVLIPLLGTTIGSFIAIIFKNEIKENIYKIIIGFAAGVMMAASIWSLIIPAIELSGENKFACFIPASIGLIIGILFLLLFDFLMKDKNVNMLNFSVIIHNIPEGFSVGVAFALALTNDIGYMSTAFLLAIGIGIQNIPEGSVISLNMLKYKSKPKAIFYGFLSGVVEPIASVVAIFLIFIIQPILPYTLAFAAGAMLYVVINELTPFCYGVYGTIGFSIGFCIMMILDVMLG